MRIFLICLVGLANAAFGETTYQLPRSTLSMPVGALVECMDESCIVGRRCAKPHYWTSEPDAAFTTLAALEAGSLYEVPAIGDHELVCAVRVDGAANVTAVISHRAQSRVVSRETVAIASLGSFLGGGGGSGSAEAGDMADGDGPTRDCHPATRSHACRDDDHVDARCGSPSPSHVWIGANTVEHFYRNTQERLLREGIPEGRSASFFSAIGPRAHSVSSCARFTTWEVDVGLGVPDYTPGGCVRPDQDLDYLAPEVDGDTWETIRVSVSDGGDRCMTTTMKFLILDTD